MSKENELPQIESKLEFDPNVPHVQGSMIPEDEDNKTNVEEHSDVKPKDLIEGDDIIIEDKTKEEKYEINPIKNNIAHKIDEEHQESHKLPSGDKTNENIQVENENNFPYQKKITKAQKLVQDKLKVPPRLFKTFIITLILAVVGVVLIILGCIESIAEKTPGKGIMFWVLGSVVIIPGGFYSYQFYKAKKAKDEYQREDIFDNIPEL